MDYLKVFLQQLTNNEIYYAEIVDQIAELYIQSDSSPAVFIEFDGEVFNVNFRCDMASGSAAQITHDMTAVNRNIVIGPDFFSTSESGIVYGEEALGLYFASVLKAYEMTQVRQEAELDEFVYVVQQPIYAYGNKNNERKNKMQRLWGTDLE